MAEDAWNNVHQSVWQGLWFFWLLHFESCVIKNHTWYWKWHKRGEFTTTGLIDWLIDWIFPLDKYSFYFYVLKSMCLWIFHIKNNVFIIFYFISNWKSMHLQVDSGNLWIHWYQHHFSYRRIKNITLNIIISTRVYMKR